MNIFSAALAVALGVVFWIAFGQHVLRADIGLDRGAPILSSATPPAPSLPVRDVSCSKESDCGELFLEEGTCEGSCDPQVGNQRWIKEVRAACDVFCALGHHRTCVQVKCDVDAKQPTCIDGQCKLSMPQ